MSRRYHRRDRRAVSAVIGTAIALAIVFTILVPLIIYTQELHTLFMQEASRRLQYELERIHQKLEVHATVGPNPVQEGLPLYLILKNPGTLSVSIPTIYVESDVHGLRRYDVSILLVPGQSIAYELPFRVSVNPPDRVKVKVVTLRGNGFYSEEINPQEPPYILLATVSNLNLGYRYQVEVEVVGDYGCVSPGVGSGEICGSRATYSFSAQELGESDIAAFMVTPGNYSVSLSVTSPKGSDTETKADYIVVSYSARSEIIGTWSSGIWFWDAATSRWTKMYSGVPSGAIVAGDFTGDGRADVASIWSSGLWYQDGATLAWTKVSLIAPDRLGAGDITGDGVDEIIGYGGDWDSGFWYRDVANGTWHRTYDYTPNGAIAAGDVTGDGKADMISCWSSGLWYQDGGTFDWTKVYGTAPHKVTAGDVTGDGQAEIIGTWSGGIWYWDVAKSEWTKMTSYTTARDMAAGDFTGDGRADVASCWSSGLWYQNGATLGWTRVYGIAPSRVTAGDVTGN